MWAENLLAQTNLAKNCLAENFSAENLSAEKFSAEKCSAEKFFRPKIFRYGAVGTEHHDEPLTSGCCVGYAKARQSGDEWQCGCGDAKLTYELSACDRVHDFSSFQLAEPGRFPAALQ